MDYTVKQLQTQRKIREQSLAADLQRLASLDKLPADVRENHRRTIEMRIAVYRKQISDLIARGA